MSTIKLTYFDMSGGRAEPLRIILNAGKIPFEDHRISFDEFGKMVRDFPMAAVPVIDIDGTVYTQSNAFLRYYGTKTGFYPEDPWEAFKCDEVMGATEDLINKAVQTFWLKDEALVAARKKLVDGPITQYLKFLDTRLGVSGHYVADNRLTVGDLKVFFQLRSLSSGTLDHVPANTVSTVAPRVHDYFERIANEAVIVNYYAD